MGFDWSNWPAIKSLNNQFACLCRLNMEQSRPLSELRTQIDSIDDEILVLLNKRAQVAIEVAKTKIAAGEKQCFYRPDREATVLRRIKGQNNGPLADETIVFLFRELMSACLALEKADKGCVFGARRYVYPTGGA